MTPSTHRGDAVSRVSLRDGRSIYLRSTSESKPEISETVLKKWQDLVNLVARTLHQPHALITRMDSRNLNVFLHNASERPVFAADDKFPLGIGVYCETTMGSNRIVHVPDAQANEVWKNNPSVEFGLIAYIGAPIRWPDGEIFGTICSLDDKPHYLGPDDQKCLGLFKSIIETDLELLMEKDQLRRSNESNVIALRESHHRIKNHLNIITGMMQLETSLGLDTLEDYVKFYEDMEQRIRAVAELHSLLAYGSRESVNLREYLGKIVTELAETIADDRITTDIDLDEVVIDERHYIGFGIIINELVTNSFRHAFQNHPDPRIQLTLKRNDESFSLRYKDNGPGLPEGFFCSKAGSLGMQLICELASQAGGSLTVNNDCGAEFLFEFPLQAE